MTTKEEIKEMMYAYYKSVDLEEFMEYVADSFYKLQERICNLEENKLIKEDLEKFIVDKLKGIE